MEKTQAIVNGKDLPISIKQTVAISNMIRRKNIDKAIKMLEEVLKFKKPVPMKGEIPHRKGKIMSGRYPIKACKVFIMLLKSLRSNAIVNDLELEKYELFCMPNVAFRPYKRFGQGRFKRSHVQIKLIPLKSKNDKPN
jgi:ribosomal protein L22